MRFDQPPSRAAQHDREARTRAVSWQDPAIALPQLAAMSGLEYLRGMRRFEVPAPPMARLIGIDIESIEEGRVVMTLEPDEHFYNPIGVVHGGMLSTLLDTVMGCSLHSTLEAGVGYTTSDLHVQFVRPVTIGSGRVRAIGEVLHKGGRMATAQGRLSDAEGRLCAHASSTLVLLSPHARGAATG